MDCAPEDVLKDLLGDKALLNCAGALMVEHPIMQKYVEKIEGAYPPIAPDLTKHPTCMEIE